MYSFQFITRLILILCFLFIAGVACKQVGPTNTQKDTSSNPDTSSHNMFSTDQANTNTQTPASTNSMMPIMMGQMPMMAGQMNGMMNPHMYLNMMAQMSNQISGIAHPMMSGNITYPMMGIMGPVIGPMMPNGMGSSTNPMANMHTGQMMDPKQYEEWFNQMTEMMKNVEPQPTQ
jgi:hypothetical protein